MVRRSAVAGRLRNARPHGPPAWLGNDRSAGSGTLGLPALGPPRKLLDLFQIAGHVALSL